MASTPLGDGKLAFLVQDVLDNILRLVDGRDVIKLWLCGSSKLEQNISSCVTLLNFGKSAAGPLQQYTYLPWPGAFFRRLRVLQTLNIQLREASFCITGGDYNDLPSSITDLQVSCVNAWTLFWDSEAPTSPFEGLVDRRPDSSVPIFPISIAFPNLKSLVLKGTQTDSDNLDVNNRILSSLPASLTRLEVPDSVASSMSILKSLPPNLGNLRLTRNVREQLLENFDEIPRSVTCLSIQLAQFRDEHVENLPPNLTDLQLESDVLTCRAIEKLPKTLRTLRMTAIVLDHPSGESPEQLEAVRHLPPDLTQLLLPGPRNISMDDVMVMHLPCHLTMLVCMASFVTNDGIRALPPSLTYLCLEYCRSISDQCIADLPRQLKSLILPTTATITGDSMADLPPTLTTLVLPLAAFFEDHHIPHIPRTVSTLTLRSALNLTVACVPHLPPSLTSLNVPDGRISHLLWHSARRTPQPSSCAIQ